MGPISTTTTFEFAPFHTYQYSFSQFDTVKFLYIYIFSNLEGLLP